MSIKGLQNNNDQEIDLLSVFSRIGDFFEWMNTLLFRIVRFFVKNRLTVAVLILFGFGLGMYLQKSNNSYDQKIIVIPNFKSTEYLYSKIDLLASKIALKDTLFLKSIGIQNPEQIKAISLGPIVNVNDLISEKDKGVQVLELMKESEDLKIIVKDTTLRKYYNYHILRMNTYGKIASKSTIDPIFNFLNTSVYYDSLKKINLSNIQEQIKIKETTLNQIDGILNKFSATTNNSSNDRLIYYNEDIKLDEVIKTKDSISVKIGLLKLKLYNSDKTIKESGMVLNTKKYKSLQGKLTYVLPLLLVGLFVFLRLFIAFYKKQSLKAQQME